MQSIGLSIRMVFIGDRMSPWKTWIVPTASGPTPMTRALGETGAMAMGKPRFRKGRECRVQALKARAFSPMADVPGKTESQAELEKHL